MTAHKKLKQRVRERMEKTGESYTAALAHARAEAPASGVEVEEQREVTREAERLGFGCPVFASESLDDGEVPFALQALRALLDDRRDEVGALKFGRCALHGMAPVALPSAVESIHTLRRFFTDARRGLRGFSNDGVAAVFDSEVGGRRVAVTALCFGAPDHPPALWVTRLDALGAWFHALPGEFVSWAMGAGWWARGGQ